MRDLLPRLRRTWWIVASGIALGVAAAAALTAATPPLYVSSAKVYVSILTQPDSTSLVQGSQFAQQQIASYAEVATSPLVLQPVIARLNLPVTPAELAGRVSAKSPEGTSLIALDVQGSDARQVTLVVNAVADELIKAVATLERPTTSTASPVRGTVVERGVQPTTAIAPKPKYNLGLGLLLGLLLGVLASLARESWDERLRDRPGLPDDLGVPVLGALSDAPHTVPLTTWSEIPTQATFDEFRRICATLEQRLKHAAGSTVLVTSSTAGEGKTTLVTGLAAAFAEDGSRVVVVDADLRTAALSHRLAPDATTGLAPMLDERGPEPAGALVALGNFDVLPSGGLVANPSALLTTRLMTPLLQELQARYDVVLVDAPSVQASSDAARLAPLAALTVLVAGTHTTTLPAMRTSIAAIDAAGGTVAGAVVNAHRGGATRGRGPIRTSGRRGRPADWQGGEFPEQRNPGPRMARRVRGIGERV